MMQRIVFLILTLSLGIIFSCSGGGGGDDTPACAAPTVDATGTWCVTLTHTSNNCSAPLDTVPYAAVYTQSGNSVSATAKGVTYSGSICDNTATLTGPTSSTNVTFSDANHASGTTTWDTGTCQGTDTSIATKGTCT